MALRSRPLKIKKLCVIAEWLSLLFVFAVVISFGLMFFAVFIGEIDAIKEIDEGISNLINLKNLNEIITPQLRYIILTILITPSLLLIFLMYQTRRIFSAYRQDQFFTAEIGRYFSTIGWLLAFIPLLDWLIPIFVKLVILMLTTAPQISKTLFDISIETEDLVVISFAFLFIIFGHVHVEATHIAEENKSFV